MSSVRSVYKKFFLSFVVLGLYYPAIFSGYNLVDDVEVFGRLDSAEQFNISGYFFEAARGEYYRPLTTLTFYLDKVFWSLEPSFMHLENIALHVANVLLVFMIANKIFRDHMGTAFELPLLCSLLVAVHPVNSEAVNWISARYDLLATCFVLVAVVLIQKGVEARNYIYFIIASLSLFMGCLAKETALLFFPVGIIFVHSLTKEKDTGYPLQKSSSVSLLKATVPFVTVLVCYLLLRMQAVQSGKSGIALAAERIMQGAAYSIVDTLRVFFKLFGFYVKKLFVPVPLNFAIVSVHDLYLWVGLGALLALIYLVVRNKSRVEFLIASFFLTLPAIVLTFSRIAWTPVAERYLYLPSAFFSIGIIGMVFDYSARFGKQIWVTAAVSMLIVLSSYVTADRSLVWQNNIALYQDTVRKSPEFKKLRNELAIALRGEGRVDEADKLLEIAKRENPKHTFLYINQADLRLAQNKPSEARRIILASMENKKTANPEALKMLARIDEQRLFAETSRTAAINIALEIIDTLDHLYSKTHDPFCVYRAGQLLLFVGEGHRAGEYFQKAYDAAPEGIYFKEPAKKLAAKLKSGAND